MSSGWIKLHRSLLDWEYYDDKNALRLLVHLLVSVNYKDKTWNGQEIKSGSMVFSWPKLSKEVGMTVQETRTAMKKLESSREVNRISTGSYQIVSLVKWDKMQQDTDEPNRILTGDLDDKNANRILTGNQQDFNRQSNRKLTGNESPTGIVKSIDTDIEESEANRNLTGSLTGCQQDSNRILTPTKEIRNKNKEIYNKKPTKNENEKVFSKAVHDCFDNCLKYFDEELWPKPKSKSEENWLDTIDKLNRLDGVTFNQIENVVKGTRQDEFWIKNFLTMVKLRKKSPSHGVPYIVVFSQMLKNNKNEKRNELNEIAAAALASGKGY